MQLETLGSYIPTGMLITLHQYKWTSVEFWKSGFGVWTSRE